jgi:hypothetical protein
MIGTPGGPLVFLVRLRRSVGPLDTAKLVEAGEAEELIAPSGEGASQAIDLRNRAAAVCGDGVLGRDPTGGPVGVGVGGDQSLRGGASGGHFIVRVAGVQSGGEPGSRGSLIWPWIAIACRRSVCPTRYGDNPRARSGRRRRPARGRPAGHFPADRMSLDRVGRRVGPLQLPVCFASDRPADGRPCDAQQLGRLGGASSPEFGSASRWRRTPFRLRVDGFRDQPGHSTGTKNGQAGGWSIWPAGHSR